jgi:hypothetical protein
VEYGRSYPDGDTTVKEPGVCSDENWELELMKRVVYSSLIFCRSVLLVAV